MKKSIVATKSKSCSYTRWLRKKVYEKKILYNGKTLNGLIQNGKDKFDYSMTIENGALCLAYDADISKLSPRPFFSVKIPFEPGDYSNYNRVRVKVFVAAEGFQNMYWHFCLQGDEKGGMHAPSTPVNEWYDCVWEINYLDRSNLSFITVMPFVGGCPPEALKDVKVYIKSIALEKVDPDYELGYQLEDRIAYSHLGYYPNAKKEFIVQKGETFKILKNKKVVYSANLKEVETTLGKFKVGNFSHITERGTYQIECDGLSEEFAISDSPYTKGIQGSLDFLYQLRCGEDIPLVHSACHLNAKAISNGKTVPVFGGWHDAGDLSQFEICTAEMTRALLDLSFTNKKLNKRILEEAKVGLNWLLRTTFKDGTRALAISYRHWYDNIVTAEDKYPLNSGENGPFENFIAADALAYGYLAFKDTDKVFANWCLRTAIDDFKFGVLGYAEGKYTKRWGPSIPAQALGSALSAASRLYQATKDIKYIDQAAEYAKVVLACQQSEYPNWDKPIRGFFYENPEHSYTLTYEHRGHEESPVTGLADLYNVAYWHKDSKEWKKGLLLYKEYITTTMEMTAPYNFLIGHVYELDKINMDRFTVPASYGTKEQALEMLKEQVRNGIKLSETAYARRLPIAIQRRGYHATLLSKAKAVSSIAAVLKDDELAQIAKEQLEWIHGKNPFASSTMFGVGHNYHPLYVAYSNQMYGALPVGIETLGDTDEPYWPANCNAVFKEVWGHTTGKYLSVIADLEK